MDLEKISHFLVLFNRSRSKQHLPFYKQATNVYCSGTGGRFGRGVFPLKRVNSRRVEKSGSDSGPPDIIPRKKGHGCRGINYVTAKIDFSLIVSTQILWCWGITELIFSIHE